MLTFSSSQLGTPQRAQTYAVLKSLVDIDSAFPTSSGALPGQAESAGQIVINFPCMPDTIELARRANYTNVLTSPVTPDGLHLYNHTEPLSIPISFSLHGYDRDYCQDAGPLMLLSIAAKLHALTMPLHRGGVLGLTPLAASVTPVAQGATPSEPQVRETANATFVANGVAFSNPTGFSAQGRATGAPFAYPPPCSLNLMLAQLGGSAGAVSQSNDGVRSMGINCIGFISDVRVVLHGPWLQGSFGTGGVRNMPSWAEFSFTFVHQPGHTNWVGDFGVGGALLTTTARDIYQRLYNTADLTTDRALAGAVRYADLNTPFNP